MGSKKESPAEPVNLLRPPRPEWFLVGGILLVGLALRIAFPGRLAIEHFDEGVYASNIWFDAENENRYPARHLYAPPLHPFFTELSVSFFGAETIGPFLVNILAGSGTILLVWWLGRTWFGIPAGIGAAVLCALSDYHILYSRTALTDPLLGFWLIAAVIAIKLALEEPSAKRIVLAAMLVSLAWWTKYNGWLALAIGGAGLVPWLIFHAPNNVSRIGRIGIFGVIVVSAWVLWTPALVDLQGRGGYAAVSANQSGYFVGFAGWWKSLNTQILNLRLLDGPFGILSLPISLIVVTMFTKCFTWNIGGKRDYLFLGSVAVFCWGASSFWGSFTVLLVLGFVGSVMRLVGIWRERTSPDDSRNYLAEWMLAAWFFGLLLGTSLYTPYPRLVIPLIVCCWINTGTLIQTLTSMESDRLCKRFGTTPKKLLVFVLAGTGLATGIFSFSQGVNYAVPGWQDRTSARSVAKQFRKSAGKEATKLGRQNPKEIIVYVYAEPAVFYHLRANDILAAPIGSLNIEKTELPVFLITGPHAHRDPNFLEQWKAVKNRYLLIDRDKYRPRRFILLNDFKPAQVEYPETLPEEEYRLYLLK